MWESNHLALKKKKQKNILLEFSEEEVDMTDGVQLCDEGLYVFQESLHGKDIYLLNAHNIYSHCLLNY